MRNTIDDIAQLFAALAEQLIFWRDIDDDALAKKISGSVERRLLISRARDWIEAHLHQHFQIAELAAELHISPRTLQYCFVDELGHSPLAEVRRFRFRLLRRKLTSTPSNQPIEGMFRSCGLIDTPPTSRHYRNWCGETPRQTRDRAKMTSGLI